MKKQMLMAAVIFAAVSAQASKARLNALGNSEHIVDIQEVFQQEPDQALNYEAATVEFGGNGAAATQAEGGFIRKMGDSAWSLYLGRSSTTYAEFTSAVIDGVAAADANTLTTIHQQANPLQLTYASKNGDINWGAGLLYISNAFKDQTIDNAADFTGDIDQNIMGLLVGANNGVWDAQLRFGLGGKTEASGTFAGFTTPGINGATKLTTESTQSMKVSGGYMMDTMYFYGGYDMRAGEVKTNAATLADLSSTELTVGVVNSHKKDGVDFFYGISYVMETVENDVGAGTKDESTTAPILVGVEAEVSSWLTLRGSLTQNLGLLSSSKPDGDSAGAVADSTTTALGAGMKWGKAMVDVVVSTGTDGNFGFDSGGDILSQASVTYSF
jgi:hypothetical protein